MTQEWNLLHLTDLHLKKDAYFDDPKIDISHGHRERKFDAFLQCLKKYKNKQKFDAILVTGDLTTKVDKKGLKLFTRNLHPILKELCENSRAICIVPGNHDVAWGIDPSHPRYFEEKFASFRGVMRTIKATSSLLPKGSRKSSEEATLSFLNDEFAPVYTNHDNKLIVLCINSSISCGEVDTKPLTAITTLVKQCESIARTGLRNKKPSNNKRDTTPLKQLSTTLKKILEEGAMHALHDKPHVTAAQSIELQKRLDDLRDECGSDWNCYLKVAILHHHLIPYPYQLSEYKTFEFLPDAASVLDLLHSYGFHLTLTGHKHQPYFHPYLSGNEERDVIWIGGGTTVCGESQSPSGFRHLTITYRENDWQCEVMDINLLKHRHLPYETFIKEIKKVPTMTIGPGSIRLTQAGNTELCQIVSHEPQSVEVKLNDSTSVEKFWFISVKACKTAREEIKKALPKILKKNKVNKVQFLGLYDLYGHFDLLIRMNDPNIGSKSFTRITDTLKKECPSIESDNHRLIEPIGGHAFLETGKTRKHWYYPDQERYRKTRSQKAFILITRNEADWDHKTLSRIQQNILDFCNDNKSRLLPSQLTMSWGGQNLLIEFFLRCGQYYLFEELTRVIESVVVRPNRDKQTHMAYCHEEFHNYLTQEA